MTTNGKIVEGTVTGGSGRAADAKESLLGSLLNNGGNGLKEKHKQSLAEAVQKSLKLRREETKWGKPGSDELAVRTSRILHRPNPTDLRRAEALKANKDRYTLLGIDLIQLEKYAAGGKKSVMETLQYVMDMDADLPEALQPIGLELTQIISEIVTGTFTEGLTMLAQRSLEETDRATKVTEL